MRVVRSVLDMARAAGIPAKRLLEQVALDAQLLRDDTRRVPWRSFALLLRTVVQEVGGPEQVEKLGDKLHVIAPELERLAPLFPSCRDFLRFAATAFVPAQFSTIRFDHRSGRDGAVEMRYEIPDGHDDSPEFGLLLFATLQGMPRYCGLPDAKVKAELESRAGRFQIKLPDGKPSAKVRARRAEELIEVAAEELAQTWGEVGAAWRGFREYESRQEQDNERVEILAQMGFALAAAPDPIRRAETIVEVVSAWNRCSGAAIFAGETLLASMGERSPADEELTRELTLGGRHVGKLVVWAEKWDDSHRKALERLAPWVSLVLAPLVDVANARPSNDIDEFNRRLQRAISIWDLTERQQQVLRLLVRGKSNKEIASELQCAERTVEIHVTHLLRKSDAASRAMITAKFWTEL